MTVRVPVYDTGMLIALADRKAKAVALHCGLKATPHRALILGPVLAQVWRSRPAVIHALAGVLQDCAVPGARASEPSMRATRAGQPECVACAVGPVRGEARQAGDFTSDPEDIEAYLGVLNPRDVHVERV